MSLRAGQLAEILLRAQKEFEKEMLDGAGADQAEEDLLRFEMVHAIFRDELHTDDEALARKVSKAIPRLDPLETIPPSVRDDLVGFLDRTLPPALLRERR